MDYPETVKLGQPVTVKSTWVNVGVARRYKGATLCASLGDSDGTPRLALPLKGGQNRRYPVGKIVITE